MHVAIIYVNEEIQYKKFLLSYISFHNSEKKPKFASFKLLRINKF